MNGPTIQDLWNKFIWIRGIPPIDFWTRRETMIGEFIRSSRLKPMDTSGYEMGAMAGAAREAGQKAIRRPPFPGGMRMAHLHFEGNVYPLNEKQWQSFSNAVVRDLGEKLANASALSFDQLRDIAEGIDKVG